MPVKFVFNLCDNQNNDGDTRKVRYEVRFVPPKTEASVNLDNVGVMGIVIFNKDGTTEVEFDGEQVKRIESYGLNHHDVEGELKWLKLDTLKVVE